jgi:Mce-associated membrane protein
MSISLYDLLDVDDAADAAEIRAAWKKAIADLDPTDRRFRAYNDAAGVLLDPEKRAAYDADLAVARAEDETVDTEPVTAAAAAPEAAPRATEVPVAEQPPVEPSPVPPPAEPSPAGPPSAGPPTWSLFVAAGVAVVVLVLTVVVLTWPGSLGGDSPAAQKDQAAQAEDAGAAAEDAAAEAVPVVLSYDYRTIDADFAKAAAYLTDDFAAQRDDLFDQKGDGDQTLRQQVVAEKVVVTAQLAATPALTRVSPDGTRATVVVYVDQDSQKGRAAPRTLRMWATLSMVKDGNKWLIDDICTETDCS